MRLASIACVTDQVGAAREACVFCQIVAGTLPCAKVAEDETTFAFMDIHPGSDGHLLVIPKRHSADLVDISAGDLVATTLAAQRIARAALSGLGADGVNLFNCSGAAAWQTVFHFHIHVLPRWEGDGMALAWPAKNPTREALEEMAAKLRAAL